MAEGAAGVRERVADVTFEQAHPAEEDEDLGRAPVVFARLGDRVLAPHHDRGQVGPPHAGEREQHVRSLRRRRRLGEQLVEDGRGPVAIAGEAVPVGAYTVIRAIDGPPASGHGCGDSCSGASSRGCICSFSWRCPPR
jgi:hypothetical protein